MRAHPRAHRQTRLRVLVPRSRACCTRVATQTSPLRRARALSKGVRNTITKTMLVLLHSLIPMVVSQARATANTYKHGSVWTINCRCSCIPTQACARHTGLKRRARFRLSMLFDSNSQQHVLCPQKLYALMAQTSHIPGLWSPPSPAQAMA
eukprot:6207805-Pleurochrysis_carterae.AAC.6